VPDTSQRGPSTHSKAAHRYLDEFWELAWDTPFILRHSGMTLESTGVNAQWDVVVREGFETVAKGSYQELLRLRIPSPGLRAVAAAGPNPPEQESLVTFDHFVTAGVVEAATGVTIPTYGIVNRVVLSGPELIVVEGMTPLGVAEDVAAALSNAADVFELMSASEPDPRRDVYPADPCHCDELYDNDIAACAIDAIACQAACAAAALAGLVGCLVMGPFLPACVAAVLTAEVLCIAGCLARQRACNLRAYNDWIECLEECDNE
jgi:hypothetical protein